MNIPSTLRTLLLVLLLHADSDVTTAKYQILERYSVIIVKSCMPTIITCLQGFYYSFVRIAFHISETIFRNLTVYLPLWFVLIYI